MITSNVDNYDNNNNDDNNNKDNKKGTLKSETINEVIAAHVQQL